MFKNTIKQTISIVGNDVIPYILTAHQQTIQTVTYQTLSGTQTYCQRPLDPYALPTFNIRRINTQENTGRYSTGFTGDRPPCLHTETDMQTDRQTDWNSDRQETEAEMK